MRPPGNSVSARDFVQSDSHDQTGEHTCGKTLGGGDHDSDRRAEPHDDQPAERQGGGHLWLLVSVDWPVVAALNYCHLVPFCLTHGGELGGPLFAQRTVAFGDDARPARSQACAWPASFTRLWTVCQRADCWAGLRPAQQPRKDPSGSSSKEVGYAEPAPSWRLGRLQCLVVLRIATLGGDRRAFAAAGMDWTPFSPCRMGHWSAVSAIQLTNQPFLSYRS